MNPVPLLRACLIWLALLALPLQGFAAASMLFCGSQAPAGAHHVHDGGDRHADHDHSAQHDADAAAADSTVPVGDAGGGHRCGVCAACCNLAVIAGFLPRIAPAAGPPAGLPPVVLRVATRVVLLPDKPPRA